MLCSPLLSCLWNPDQTRHNQDNQAINSKNSHNKHSIINFTTPPAIQTIKNYITAAVRAWSEEFLSPHSFQEQTTRLTRQRDSLRLFSITAECKKMVL